MRSYSLLIWEGILEIPISADFFIESWFCLFSFDSLGDAAKHVQKAYTEVENQILMELNVN